LRDGGAQTVGGRDQRRAGATQHVELAMERPDRVLGVAIRRPSEKARSKDHRPHQHEDNENHDRQDPLTCLPVVETLLRDLLHLVDGRDGNNVYGSPGNPLPSQSGPSLQDEAKNAGRNGEPGRRKRRGPLIASPAGILEKSPDTHRVVPVAQRDTGSDGHSDGLDTTSEIDVAGKEMSANAPPRPEPSNGREFVR
jgi:hypothetical protein